MSSQISNSSRKKMFGLLSIVSIFCGVSEGKYLNFRAKNLFCGTFPKLSVIILCRSEVWRWYRSRLEKKKWRGHLWTVKKHLPFFLVANSGLAHASHILIGKNWSNWQDYKSFEHMFKFSSVSSFFNYWTFSSLL